MFKRLAIATIGALVATGFLCVLFEVTVELAAEFDVRPVAAIVFMLLFVAIFFLLKPRYVWDDDEQSNDRDPLSDSDDEHGRL